MRYKSGAYNIESDYKSYILAILPVAMVARSFSVNLAFFQSFPDLVFALRE